MKRPKIMQDLDVLVGPDAANGAVTIEGNLIRLPGESPADYVIRAAAIMTAAEHARGARQPTAAMAKGLGMARPTVSGYLHGKISSRPVAMAFRAAGVDVCPCGWRDGPGPDCEVCEVCEGERGES